MSVAGGQAVRSAFSVGRMSSSRFISSEGVIRCAGDSGRRTHTIPASFTRWEWLRWARISPCAVMHLSGVCVGAQESLLENHWN